ncbi:hypothetical protein [Streptomyces sp. B6B3]|uniref:hypothetical protein n=1 Tax=Streptomyces sp. B6B3 TaxID=3153570 RepID=UPI00325E04A1
MLISTSMRCSAGPRVGAPKVARTITDRWTAEPDRTRTPPGSTVDNDRTFQLIEVRADHIHVENLLDLGNSLYHRVEDLRWTPGRRHRLAPLMGLSRRLPRQVRKGQRGH